MDIDILKVKLHQLFDSLDVEIALQILHEAAAEYAKKDRHDILDSLTDEQMLRLNTSIKQASEGNTIPHADAMQTLAKWRNK